eukprot:gene14155-15633_t
MSAIQKVAGQALLTFRSKDVSAFAANLEKLKGMVDVITTADINVQKPSKKARRKRSNSFDAPVSYINIFESPYFTMGVFILRNGVSIPLHNHPGMYGICKVLYGSVKVKSYDQLASPNGVDSQSQGKFIKCKANEEQVFSETHKSYSLTPTLGNYHSIQAHNGQSAFLDILGPPYVTGDRDCSYFKECSVEDGVGALSRENESERWLAEISQPLDFYCDGIDYEGPPINLEL